MIHYFSEIKFKSEQILIEVRLIINAPDKSRFVKVEDYSTSDDAFGTTEDSEVYRAVN